MVIVLLVGVGGVRAQGGWRNHIARSRCLQDPLGDATVLALLGKADQAVGFERPQVVADLLTSNAGATGQGCGRRRLDETRFPGGSRLPSVQRGTHDACGAADIRVDLRVGEELACGNRLSSVPW